MNMLGETSEKSDEFALLSLALKGETRDAWTQKADKCMWEQLNTIGGLLLHKCCKEAR